jgi:outer membrane autotransporter protein
VKSQSETSLQARLGVRLSRAFESSRGFIRPYLHMACVREFETGGRDLTADLFGESLAIKVPGIEANGLRVDAGIDWDVTKAVRAGIRYTAQYNGACDESMGVRASVSFAF